MDNELIPYEEDFDMEKLPEPKQEIIKHKGGRKSTEAVYEQRVTEALELILYKKLSHNEFRATFSKLYGVSERTADTVHAQCKKILKERFLQKQEEIISEQSSRYFDLLERARADGNKRVERETLWDLSRIMGLDQRKIDITSNGEKLDIKINLSNNPNDFNV
jgi:hypothetical protein